jgi:uncharacterized lipoprotein NlpE involved in copper resistance
VEKKMNKKSIIAVIAVAVTALAGCQNTNTAQQSVDKGQVEVVDAHSAKISLDWNGIYQGVVPCEDCAGTNLWLELKMDGQYSLARSYIDKMSATVIEEGAFTWNEAGNSVQVGEYRFFVGENQLFLLDDTNERLKDEQGQFYKLMKAPM